MSSFVDLTLRPLRRALARLSALRQRHDSLADLDERGLRDLGLGASEIAYIDARSRRCARGLSRRDLWALGSRGIA